VSPRSPVPILRLLGLTIALAHPASAAGAAGAAGAPNVALLMTDDQGWFDVGFHGNSHIATPHLDRLAAESVRFTRFYAEPVCTPTRAGLMTGRCYLRTGANDTYMGRDTMSDREITLGQVFQARGYRTAIFGKWHLGRYMRYHPTRRGFDEFLGFWQYGFINRYDDPDELFAGTEPVAATGYITDVLTDAAIAFLKARGDRPFFLYVPYNAPHSPYLVPDEEIEPYLRKGLPLQEARIYGMITRIDRNVGRLLAQLDEQGLAENTVVLFLTDNGGVSRCFKAGLRGNKASVYEGGIRVPLLARWPGRFPAGASVEAMAHITDLFPTLCELIGGERPADRTIDGRSLLPLMKAGDGPGPHEYMFHQWTRVRPDPDKNWAAQDGRYKLVEGALYDLEADPGEERDIAAEHPEIVDRLRRRFLAWFADVTAGQDYRRVPIEVGRPDEDPVELDVTWAEPVGRKVKPIYRRYIRDAITDWTEPDDAVRWELDVTRPGRYELTLSYGLDPGAGGSRFRVTAGASSLTATTAAGPAREVFRRRAVGTLDLPAGRTVLELRAETIANRELMLLHRAWLRRAGPLDDAENPAP
jgi:arylsulfatase A